MQGWRPEYLRQQEALHRRSARGLIRQVDAPFRTELTVEGLVIAEIQVECSRGQIFIGHSIHDKHAVTGSVFVISVEDPIAVIQKFGVNFCGALDGEIAFKQLHSTTERKLERGKGCAAEIREPIDG